MIASIGSINRLKLIRLVADRQASTLPEEQERQAKEQAQQQAERSEAFLRSQGIDPNQLSDL